MKCSRRQFFTGRWSRETETVPERENDESPAREVRRLPPDFTPALLRMQAKMMKLDVDNMSNEEVEQAVLAALYSQKPTTDHDEGQKA